MPEFRWLRLKDKKHKLSDPETSSVAPVEAPVILFYHVTPANHFVFAEHISQIFQSVRKRLPSLKCIMHETTVVANLHSFLGTTQLYVDSFQTCRQWQSCSRVKTRVRHEIWRTKLNFKKLKYVSCKNMVSRMGRGALWTKLIALPYVQNCLLLRTLVYARTWAHEGSVEMEAPDSWCHDEEDSHNRSRLRRWVSVSIAHRIVHKPYPPAYKKNKFKLFYGLTKYSVIDVWWRESWGIQSPKFPSMLPSLNKMHDLCVCWASLNGRWGFSPETHNNMRDWHNNMRGRWSIQHCCLD